MRMNQPVMFQHATAIQCLGGDHTSCLKMKPGHCDGTEDSNWMLSSSLHKAAGVHALEFTESEKEKMRGVFNIRLHDRARDSTALGYHTQQNEAFHRMLSKNSPKNITFARNHHGRVCSTIFRFNHGHSQSIEKKLRAAGCPLYAGGLQTLHTQSIKIGKLKAYQKDWHVQASAGCGSNALQPALVPKQVHTARRAWLHQRAAGSIQTN